MFRITITHQIYSAMTYNITGIFPTIEEAIFAANRLRKAGYIKEFSGFTINSKFQPESLVEDYFIDQNKIAVYTPNINRAHKAKNIIMNYGGEITKAIGISINKMQKPKSIGHYLTQIKNRRKLKKHHF